MSLAIACGDAAESSDESPTGGGNETTGGPTSGASVGDGTGTGTADPSGDPTVDPSGDPTTDPSADDGTSETTGEPSHDPNPLFADLQPGQVLDLGPFGCTPPDGEEGCIGITDYSGMTFDAHGYRVLAFGGGHSTTMNDSVVALALDGTPTWTSLYEPTPCGSMNPRNLDAGLGAWVSGTSGPYPRPVSAHTYDWVAYAPELDELVLLGRSFTGGYCSTAGNDIGGPIAHFDPATTSWSFSSDDSTPEFSAGLAGAEYDPMTQQFVSLGSSGLAIYDPATQTMVGVFAELTSESAVDLGALGYANHLTYFPPNDTFYYFLRGSPVQVVALVLDRDDPSASSIEWVEAQGPTADHQEPGYDYDAVNGIIGGAVLDDTFHAFDPTTAMWTATPVTGGTPGTQAFHALVYDAIDDVFIFVTDYASGGNTWAYRHG